MLLAFGSHRDPEPVRPAPAPKLPEYVIVDADGRHVATLTDLDAAHAMVARGPRVACPCYGGCMLCDDDGLVPVWTVES